MYRLYCMMTHCVKLRHCLRNGRQSFMQMLIQMSVYISCKGMMLLTQTVSRCAAAKGAVSESSHAMIWDCVLDHMADPMHANILRYAQIPVPPEILGWLRTSLSALHAYSCLTECMTWHNHAQLKSADSLFRDTLREFSQDGKLLEPQC